MRKRAGGFTLIEVLVVITVIGVLMGLLLPAILKSRGVADMTKCASNLKQLGVGFSIYLNESMNLYPPAIYTTSGPWKGKSWADLVRPKLNLGKLDDTYQVVDLFQGPDWIKYKQFQCPANRMTTGGGGRFSYGYNLNCSGLNQNTVKADMIVLHCANHYGPSPVNGRLANPGNHGDGFDSYLFSDGHVEKSNTFYKTAANKAPWISVY